MADTYVAGDPERLPWLTEDSKGARRSSSWIMAFVAASVVAIIAALSFWLGMNGALRPQQPVQALPETRLDLPPASSVEATPVQPEPIMPQVEPAPLPGPVALPVQEEARLEAPPVRRVARRATVAVHRSRHAAKRSGSKARAVQEKKSLNYANPWKSTGVSGRMVRVGAYSSIEKGKEAWATLAQLSPAIKQLPAVVTDIPSPTGRTLYWLQIGTTSQAHSEVLCQRMRAIRQRCVVVDVAGARKDKKDERQPAGI